MRRDDRLAASIDRKFESSRCFIVLVDVIFDVTFIVDERRTLYSRQQWRLLLAIQRHHRTVPSSKARHN